MESPVVLPSGKVIDLSTLRRHLSENCTDPFSGSPMTEADALPHPTLKAEIDRRRVAEPDTNGSRRSVAPSRLPRPRAEKPWAEAAEKRLKLSVEQNGGKNELNQKVANLNTGTQTSQATQKERCN